MAKVKITVVKRCNCNDLFPENPPVGYDDEMLGGPQCPKFKDGQEFIVDTANIDDMPEGFCSWAFSDIQRNIFHLLFGGQCPWAIPQTATLHCCTDGWRPVIFKIERIED
ncbi:unnamed protein product [marine sediment metagenome]|uniref:TIGR04076 family protein n=1 Tax=marine sediment metagenome TaxID=412755 RepID=X1FQ45_9ZZZZ